jgi:hypothetical protein
MKKLLSPLLLFFVCISFFVNAQKVTYYEHIAPIIYKNCSFCHRPNQSAPFDLLTYEDIAKRAKMIDYVIDSRFMPPWRADTTYRRFVDERILTDEQVTQIKDWIKAGKPKGDIKKVPPKPDFYSRSGLGTPDLVIKLPNPFPLKGENRDTVVHFVLPYEIANDTNVRAFEFVPGNPKAVHHANAKVISTKNVPADHEWDFMKPDSFADFNMAYYDGWVPGALPRNWPEGFGFRMPKKGVVLLQVHYAPSSIAQEDQSQINIFFTDKRATRPLEVFNLGSNGGVAEPEPPLMLPPESVKSFTIRADVAKDLSYLYLNPHMHCLGKEMKAYAVPPKGDTIPLIWIKEWDFRWQDFYKPKNIIKIPKGSVIYVHATFDNTAANPANPNNPPKRVVQGPNTTDEMMSIIIMSVEYKEGDENIRLKSDLHY